MSVCLSIRHQMRVVSALVCIVLTGSLRADIADHVSFIEVSVTQRYDTDPAAPTEYEFDCEIETDDTVASITVVTPAGRSFDIPPLQDQYDPVDHVWTTCEPDDDCWNAATCWVWEYEHDMGSMDALNDRYGDGWYRITVTYTGGGQDQTSVWFGVPGTQDPLAMPTQTPDMVTPVYRASLASPVTFQWQPCTDPAVRVIWIGAESNADTDVEPNSPLAPTRTTWGPVDLVNGYWEASLQFINGFHPMLDPGLANPDGIPYMVAKLVAIEVRFVVGRPWAAYEVWGGDQDFMDQPEWWRYHADPGAHGYTLLASSPDGRPLRADGNYIYYIILAHEPIAIDCVRGSDGTYYQGRTVTVCADWTGLTGPCDGQYMQLGADCLPGTVRLENPDGTWHWLRIVTTGCPSADLTGDCAVDLADLAIVAEQWLLGAD